MAKIDAKSELKHLYRASAREIVQIEVPPPRYLMVDGRGDPNTCLEYAQAVEALFSVAYAAKFDDHAALPCSKCSHCGGNC